MKTIKQVYVDDASIDPSDNTEGDDLLIEPISYQPIISDGIIISQSLDTNFELAVVIFTTQLSFLERENAGLKRSDFKL